MSTNNYIMAFGFELVVKHVGFVLFLFWMVRNNDGCKFFCCYFVFVFILCNI